RRVQRKDARVSEHALGRPGFVSIPRARPIDPLAPQIAAIFLIAGWIVWVPATHGREIIPVSGTIPSYSSDEWGPSQSRPSLAACPGGIVMGATETRIHIPAGEGRAARVPAGGRFRITDLRGRQCCDLFAFNARDLKEYASAEH